MPSSNPDSLISFRDVALAEEYDRLVGRSRRHQAIKSDIKKYRHLIKMSVPNIEEVDLQIISENLKAENIENSQKATAESLVAISARLAIMISNLTPAAWFAVIEKISVRNSRTKKK
jgi:hypothetical protein